MIEVKITVNSSTLGDIDVEEKSMEIWNLEDNRAKLIELLDEARAKIDRALQLEE